MIENFSMELNKKQREILTKWLSGISSYVLTAMPVGLFLSDGSMPIVVYVILAVIGLLLLVTSLFLNRKDEVHDQIHTEVRKGIFHINNAEVTH